MSQDIKTALKEATKDLLSDESLSVVSEAFESKVKETTALAVEAALVKQDEEYADRLQQVLEAIDQDHTAKLDKIVERIDESQTAKFKHAMVVLDESHSAKLKKIVALYENAIKVDAQKFKDTLIERISDFMEMYIDKKIPVEQIAEATENARSRKIVAQIARLVSLDEKFVDSNIREALLDGKSQIDESARVVAELQKNNRLLTEKVAQVEKELILEKKLVNFPVDKKTYMMRVLSEKDTKFITENFDYVSEMFDKNEDEAVDQLKGATDAVTKGVDRTVLEESADSTKSFSSADEDGATDVANLYIPAIKKRY